MDGDKNKDGRLTEDELPPKHRARLADYELNKDGVLDKDEHQKIATILGERKRPLVSRNEWCRDMGDR